MCHVITLSLKDSRHWFHNSKNLFPSIRKFPVIFVDIKFLSQFYSDERCIPEAF